MVGTIAEESILRKNSYLKHGCNAFDLRRPKSRPLGFWTEQDVLEYLATTGINYSSVYGKVVKHNGKYKTTKAKRTGCVFCGFGAHLEDSPNRYQRLAETHPKLYKYCIDDLGFGKVLDFIGVEYRPNLRLFKEKGVE